MPKQTKQKAADTTAVATISASEKKDMQITVVTLEKKASAVKVTSDTENAKASELLSLIKDKRKKVSEFFDTRIKPIKQGLALLQQDLKSFDTPLANAEARVKKAIGDYFLEKEAKARAESERLKAEEAARLEKLTKKLESTNPLTRAEAEATAQEIIINTDRELQKVEPVTSVKTAAGSSGVRKMWTYEMLNEADVPREYCKPDSSLINAAIKLGKRDIPGVRIFERAVVSGSTR